jgi:serine/threonine protein phosphatase 1
MLCILQWGSDTRYTTRMFRWITPRPATALAAIPPDMRVYAIGDIHGRKDCLDALLVQIHQHIRDAPIPCAQIIFLGDYIDRGAHSRAVVQAILDMQRTLPHITCLMGNHEWALLRFLSGTLRYEDWYSWGGDTTLESYGVFPTPPTGDVMLNESIRTAFASILPSAHEAFLRALPLHATCGDYVFVHAGLRPNIPLEAQVPEDLLTIRGAFLKSPVTLPHTIIHGHSIFPTPHIRERSIGIDTGAYASGKLTAIVLEGTEYHFLTS